MSVTNEKLLSTKETVEEVLEEFDPMTGELYLQAFLDVIASANYKTKEEKVTRLAQIVYDNLKRFGENKTSAVKRGVELYNDMDGRRFKPTKKVIAELADALVD